MRTGSAAEAGEAAEREAPSTSARPAAYFHIVYAPCGRDSLVPCLVIPVPTPDPALTEAGSGGTVIGEKN
ncbi:hypothetical protein SKB0092_12560 [Roseomonas mucosa]